MHWTLKLKLLQWRVIIKVALSNQLKAFDYAFFASPYQPKFVTYYRNTVKDEIYQIT